MSIRVVALIKRRPDMTQEEFSKYWSENHGKIFANLKAVKENIVKYNQFHVLESQSNALVTAGLPVAEFQGAAEFYVEKLEDLFAVFKDEEYQKNAIPDEGNFLDRATTQLLVGEDHTKWVKA